MQRFVPFIALLMLGACAAHVVTPRAYLDEETAATITVVADPWIFTGEQIGAGPDERDYLNVFAIDVNRMGDHRQYLAVLQSAPPPALSGVAAPTLELQGGGQTVSLQNTVEQPRKLGIAKPLAPSYSVTARWWYFPVSKEILATIARSRDLQATLVAADKRLPYSIWRDGSEEIAELTSVLP
jgi:hypothetical protein